MKKIYSIILLLFVTTASFSQASDLYFSMYAEGSSNNKFLEIYNGTGADVDLTGYSLSTCSNGCNVAGEFDYPDNYTFPAGTTLSDGDVFVLANPSADATILAVADDTFSYLSNGDDAMALTLVNATASTYTIIDLIGDLQGDPGSGWDVAGETNGTQNHTLTRKTSVCGPNPNELGSFGTNATDSEWIVTASNSGWTDLGAYTGCSTSPALTITAPADGYVFSSGTTSTTLSFTTQNFTVATAGNGDGHIHWTLNSGSMTMKYDLTDETITVADGGTYTVYAELVDDSHNPLSPAVNQTITFSVENPCDLTLGTEAATCDASTSGVDTYTATIDFTGGGTASYTINVNDGTVAGDDPSAMASGTISITGVTEGTNLQVDILGGTGSSCDYSLTIDSPACLGSVVCSNPGDLIITEVMQNPSAVYDENGEWFEVYNTTASDINMSGWTVTDETNTTTEMFIISALTVPANGYVVFGNNADQTTNGGVTINYEYPSNFSLGNSTDGIIIECSSAIIDQVVWDNGSTFPDPSGYSMELATNAYDATSNDLGSNWGIASTTYGDGDYGTPGTTNSYSLSTINFNNVTFEVYPNPVTNGTLNITSSIANDMNVQIFDLLGKQVINTTISNNIVNVSTLEKGVYVLKVTQNEASITQKLVIK
ncbi:hypothetical protein NBRC110019_04550 [Neptunitalea chrysea]|uniref:LTD domain-containing protein n=1 Tax=Neptunitalea chrysea TaxID=1647581 RepID=A0A9W6B304_9FLAO|nr:lamin tail domain-containing protein [Neptunitalea chrysea]GLB51416.1 hypothetical protein NBRC110019_04550 [Neptunitalea chrysea]